MESTSKKPILVIGDTCQDVFVYCHCERLCPEAPVPVLDIQSQESNLGMAGNVYRNIIDLGHPAQLFCNTNHEAVTKTRYVDGKTNHMFLRIDSKTTINRIKNLKEINFKQFAAVVISDYNKGLLEPEDIAYIAANHPLTFLDTKKVLGDWARGVTFIKINRKEYDQSANVIDQELDSHIIETLGSEGCRFRSVTYRVNNVEIKNLSGAGDSFLAGLVVKYLETNGDIGQALVAANNVATIVVQKKGVSTVKE